MKPFYSRIRLSILLFLIVISMFTFIGIYKPLKEELETGVLNNFQNLTYNKHLIFEDKIKNDRYNALLLSSGTGIEDTMHKYLKGNVTLSEEKYIESIAEGLSNTGLMIMDEADVKIGDKTYKSVTVYGETEDISVTQQSLARKEGAKMISIAVVAFNDDSISDIMACFE